MGRASGSGSRCTREPSPARRRPRRCLASVVAAWRPGAPPTSRPRSPAGRAGRLPPYDGLAGKVPRGVVVVPPLGARFCVAAGPHRDVHSVDRRIVWVSMSKGMSGEQSPHTVLVHASHTERGIEAAPAALVDGCQAQVRWRGDGARAVSSASVSSKRASARRSKHRHNEFRKACRESRGWAEESMATHRAPAGRRCPPPTPIRDPSA